MYPASSFHQIYKNLVHYFSKYPFFPSKHLLYLPIPWVSNLYVRPLAIDPQVIKAVHFSQCFPSVCFLLDTVHCVCSYSQLFLTRCLVCWNPIWHIFYFGDCILHLSIFHLGLFYIFNFSTSYFMFSFKSLNIVSILQNLL